MQKSKGEAAEKNEDCVPCLRNELEDVVEAAGLPDTLVATHSQRGSPL